MKRGRGPDWIIISSQRRGMFLLSGKCRSAQDRKEDRDASDQSSD